MLLYDKYIIKFGKYYYFINQVWRIIVQIYEVSVKTKCHGKRRERMCDWTSFQVQEGILKQNLFMENMLNHHIIQLPRI